VAATRGGARTILTDAFRLPVQPCGGQDPTSDVEPTSRSSGMGQRRIALRARVCPGQALIDNRVIAA
jgi:hypothetical protein